MNPVNLTKPFEVLAQRMDTTAGLRVTLLLNIQRRRGDTTVAEQLVRKFADRFWGTDWPGSSRPTVYYDPRSDWICPVSWITAFQASQQASLVR